MKFAKKKAQSAMEYLMTYGWAILIVIIVAAALYALGVFNPATFTGRQATGFQVIGAPSDWDLDSAGSFKLKMSNNKLPSQVIIYTVTATIAGNQSTYNTFNCTTDGQYLTIGPGGTNDIPADCTYGVGGTTFSIYPVQGAGTTYSVGVSLLYSSGGYNHTDTGTVTGVIS